MNVLMLCPDENSGPLKLLSKELRNLGYHVAQMPLDMGAGSAQHLYTLFSGRPPDVVVADLSNAADCLPLRHLTRILSAAWEGSEPAPARLALFNRDHVKLPDWPAYADDFILPPYAMSEVTARIKLYNYKKRHIQTNHVISIGNVTIDLNENQVTCPPNQRILLTPREYDLLRFLGQHRGQFFARERLLDLVWGVYYDGGERTVDVHIRRLRSKLPNAVGELIVTRRGAYGIASEVIESVLS